MADFDFIPISVNAEDIERIAKMEINDTSIDENSGNNSLPTSAVVFNAIFGKKYFYENLETAFADVNNGQIGTNSLVTSEGATVSVDLKKSIPTITLLGDIILTASVDVIKSAVLDLNGKIATFNSGVQIRTYDASAILTVIANGGKISKNVSGATKNERILFAYYGTIKVLGGEYNIEIKNNTAVSTGAFWCRSGATLNLVDCTITETLSEPTVTNTNLFVIYGSGTVNTSDCNINAISQSGNCIGYYVSGAVNITNGEINIPETKGQCIGVWNTETGKINIFDCKINVNSIGDVCIAIDNRNQANIENCEIYTNSVTNPSLGIQNAGTLNIKNSKIFADGLAGSTDYSAWSQGVYNLGTMEVIDCKFYGIHSGLTSKGECYINGGLYEGTNHGGIYLTNTTTETTESPKKMFIENATIAAVQYRGKNKVAREGVFDPVASLYVSTGCNLSLYLDNCLIRGGFDWLMTISYQNNNVYMTNCTVDMNFKGFITADEIEKCVKGLTETEKAAMYAEEGILKTLPKPAVRIDSLFSQLYLGKGNTFKINNLLAYHSVNATGYDDIKDVIKETTQRYYIRDLIEGVSE